LGDPPVAGAPVNPLVTKLLRHQQRQNLRHQAPLIQRFQRFLRKKFYLFRRSALMTFISLRNLALGRPPLQQLAQEVAFANWRGEEEGEKLEPEAEGTRQNQPEL
ncbi:VKGC carboxylase, partial [Urocolius indicus]|nr:VKGC carboxylase [Urocolius indicus]